MKKASAVIHIIFYFLITALFLPLSGQTIPEGQLMESTQHKVMIIPFNMYNYFSDADPEIAQDNKKQTADISRLFRYGLNYNIHTRVITTGTYSILTDTTIESQQDLQMIYSSVQYVYQKPMDAFVKDSAENREIKEKDLFGLGEEEEQKKEAWFAGKKEVVEDTEQKKYLHAVVKNPAMFSQLQAEYGTDLFLFINQFELVTNYNHCLDRSANYFERKVIVHYSIYNASGKHLKGDAVTVTFSSGETNVDDIIGKNFPLIADYLNQTIFASIHPPIEIKK